MRVICATRGKVGDTALYKSLSRMVSSNGVQLIMIENNKLGLSTVYNKHITDDDLLFIHDDVWILDYWWLDRIKEGLKQYDVVGVAGNRRRLPQAASWCIPSPPEYLGQMLQVDTEYLSGAIGQGDYPSIVNYFGPCGEVELLDGVALAVNGKTLLETGLRFDEQFSFHFYDMAFCRRARTMGLKLGTIALSLAHQSSGPLTREWLETYIRYMEAYS